MVARGQWKGGDRQTGIKREFWGWWECPRSWCVGGYQLHEFVNSKNCIPTKGEFYCVHVIPQHTWLQINSTCSNSRLHILFLYRAVWAPPTPDFTLHKGRDYFPFVHYHVPCNSQTTGHIIPLGEVIRRTRLHVDIWAGPQHSEATQAISWPWNVHPTCLSCSWRLL